VPILTVELSDEIYQNAIALPADERERRVSAVFAVAVNLPAEDETKPDYHRETNEADLIAIGYGLKAEAEGRVEKGEVVFTRLMERFK